MPILVATAMQVRLEARTLEIASEVAQVLWAERRARSRFQWIVRLLGGDSGPYDAYAVQQGLVDLMIPSGGPPVGYKIGLTSKRMQEMCGIDHPISGQILSRRVHRSPCRIDSADFVRLGVESELCVMFRKDVPARDVPYEIAELQDCIGTVAAAFELIDDRDADYSALDALSLIADNSWNAGVVVAAGSHATDLTDLDGVLQINGERVDSGNSGDALGHPMAVVQWLVSHLRKHGSFVRAGDLVMTGSIVPTRFAKKGEHYCFELAGLPPVELWVD